MSGFFYSNDFSYLNVYENRKNTVKIWTWKTEMYFHRFITSKIYGFLGISRSKNISFISDKFDELFLDLVGSSFQFSHKI